MKSKLKVQRIGLPGGTQTPGKVRKVFARRVRRTLPSADSSIRATPESIPRLFVSSGKSSRIGDVRFVMGQKEGRYNREYNAQVYSKSFQVKI